MLCKVIHRNTRPHQLRWGYWEMGTAISCTECSQTTRLIQKVARDSLKALTLCAAVLPAAVFHLHVLASAFTQSSNAVCMSSDT